MHTDDWITLLGDQLKQTTLLQWLGLALGVAEVLLARANKIALYPAGIAASGIAMYLLWNAGLFAESLLSFYYIVMSIYGWWNWVKKTDQPQVRISWANRKDWRVVITIVAAGFAFLYVMLRYFTPSTVPAWDAWVSCTAWAGMWLLARRKIENWVLLNISNLFAIPLLFYKDLPLFGILTIILFIVAVQGFFAWKKILRTQAAQ